MRRSTWVCWWVPGLIWPAGMQMFIGYWTRRVDGRTPWRPFSSAMAVLVPLLAVVSPCHPYQMLQSGAVAAYGLATSLLPFWMVATLRLFDAIAARQGIARWMAVTVLTGGFVPVRASATSRSPGCCSWGRSCC